MLLSNASWAKIPTARVLRGNKCISHHFPYTLWSSIKSEFQVINMNSIFLVGNGVNTNFWLDIWCGNTYLEDFFNIPIAWRASLNYSFASYLHNHHWNLPQQVIDFCPGISSMVQQVEIPLEEKEDCRVWSATETGNLNLKDAYHFKYKKNNQFSWENFVWIKDIPPAKSFVSWRLMHNKLPTYENLKLRSCCFPSICNLCGII